MPISPKNRKSYPPDWKKIAFDVKEKAKWICQQCDRPCRKPGESWDEFKYRLARKSKALYLECCEKPNRFTLTVSHQDHDPANNAIANLKALCSGCHLRYDAKHHAKNAQATRKNKKRRTSTKSASPKHKIYGNNKYSC